MFNPVPYKRNLLLRPEVVLAKTIKNIQSEGSVVNGLKKTGEEVINPIRSVTLKKGLGEKPATITSLKAGDILAVKRASGVYYHFAVYIGNNKVIHYAAEGGDFGSKISIHEAPYSEFKGNSKDVFVLDFPDSASELPKKLRVDVSSAVYSKGTTVPFDLIAFIREMNYKIYSPTETVARARSKIGETKYSLMFNNCEHFAIWCKTGARESHQVNAVIEALITGGRRVETY